MSNKIKIYHNKDPRYGFMIQDSDEYNTTIYPFGIKELCSKYNADTVYPRGLGCGGQRYENCERIKNYDKESLDCNFFLYDESDVASKTIKPFVPKKLNNNVIIDKTRLSKIKYPKLCIDTSPDLNHIKYHGNKVKKKYNQSHLKINCIENFSISEDHRMFYTLIILFLCLVLFYLISQDFLPYYTFH